MAPYTQGVRHVREGRGDEFVSAWTEFAQWTKANAPGARWAKLLRDADDPNRFVTIGLWDSTDAIDPWRSLDGGSRTSAAQDRPFRRHRYES